MSEHEQPGAAAADPVPYLAGLRLAGLPVLVLGGGAVAARRVPGLLRAGARLTVIAPALDPRLRALADRSAIRWLQRPFRAGDLAGYWYALLATDDPGTNSAAAAEARAGRVFCVRADDAAAGTALTPATGQRDGLLVGVLSTGPARPRRVAAARDAALAALEALEAPDAGPQ